MSTSANFYISCSDICAKCVNFCRYPKGPFTVDIAGIDLVTNAVKSYSLHSIPWPINSFKSLHQPTVSIDLPPATAGAIFKALTDAAKAAESTFDALNDTFALIVKDNISNKIIDTLSILAKDNIPEVDGMNYTASIMYPGDGTLPSDFVDFLAHHETYDAYDQLTRELKSNGYVSKYAWTLFEFEYKLWKEFPGRPELRPGRQTIEGKAAYKKILYDKRGNVYYKVTVVLDDNNLVTLRQPRNFDWRPGDEVSINVTVDVLDSPHHGIGRNPRKSVKDRVNNHSTEPISVDDLLS